ncbi:MAG: hypothetical protein GY801_13815 [bacterium]|nr:hypothetical protein [bacterium]
MTMFIVKYRLGLTLLVGSLVVIMLFAARSVYAEDYALLVGCTSYPNLPQSYGRPGPANDVELLEQLLKSQFEFDANNITTLAGWPTDETQRPTYENIAREFQDLADPEIFGEGDQIVILLAGHGSQQPQQSGADDPNDPEPDGFDEIFLPSDVKGWNFEAAVVENAIVDDELRIWLDAIQKTGAFVWLIVDACNSGTMIRDKAVMQTYDRYLPPEVLMIPQDVLDAAKARAARQPQTRGLAKDDLLGLSKADDKLVAMYAAQSSEPTLEQPLPFPPDDLYYGLFTYILDTVLQESVSPLTYRELTERVNARYRSEGYLQPTPLIEGGALDQEVLGRRTWPKRPKILLGEEEPNQSGIFGLQMGHLQGLHLGDVLAVYPPAGEAQADQSVGHVTVTALSPFTALVVPVAFNDLPAPGTAQLLPGSRCQVVFVNYGDFCLKIAVQRQINSGAIAEVETYPPHEGPELIENALQTLTTDPQLTEMIVRVNTSVEADWYIRLVNDQVRLIPKSEFSPQDTASSQFLVGNVAQSTDLAEKLGEALQNIARVSNLLKIAGTTTITDEDDSGKVKVQVELLRFEDDNDQQGTVVSYDTAGRILREGDRIAFRVTNPNDFPIDVSLLFIDSGYGISAFFPEPGRLDDNRLPPGETIPLKALKGRISGDTFGLEQLVTIAVRASSTPIDFSWLEQPTLVKAAPRGADSPLGKLLTAAMYWEKLENRGQATDDLNNYAIHLLPWRTIPEEQ